MKKRPHLFSKWGRLTHENDYETVYASVTVCIQNLNTSPIAIFLARRA